MTSEKEAWAQLIDAGVLPSAEHFSPSKAGDCVYSDLLKRCQKEQPAVGKGIDASADPSRLKTLDDKFAELERLAEIQLDKSFARRVIHLRQAARTMGLPVADRELQRFLCEAQLRREGRAPLVGHRALDRTPTPWLVEGLILRGRLNLLVASPKVGKTSLLLSLISRWSHGARQFLDLPLIGACPPVLILGPDQPECDWAAMLHAEGLLDQHGRIADPIINLATAGNGWALDEEGITLASEIARQHPGLLIVIDSLRGAVQPLGFEESGAEADQPLRALIAALDGLDATVVIVHHAGKAPKSSPTLASRGSSAIPAAASQVIGLQRLDAEPGSKERRIVLSTEGRGGMPIELLIERSPDFGWIAHGDAAVVAAERRLQAAEEALNERQASVLDRVRSRGFEGLPTTAEDIQDLIPGADSLRAARSTLGQLVRKGLLIDELLATSNGRRMLYRPRLTTSRTPPCTPEPSLPSFPSSLSESQPSLVSENAYGERDRRVRRDRRVDSSVAGDRGLSSSGEEGHGEPVAVSCPLKTTASAIGSDADASSPDEEQRPPETGWQAQALALRAERPAITAYTVSLLLEGHGFHGITVRQVTELFLTWPEPEAA